MEQNEEPLIFLKGCRWRKKKSKYINFRGKRRTRKQKKRILKIGLLGEEQKISKNAWRWPFVAFSTKQKKTNQIHNTRTSETLKPTKTHKHHTTNHPKPNMQHNTKTKTQLSACSNNIHDSGQIFCFWGACTLLSAKVVSVGNAIKIVFFRCSLLVYKLYKRIIFPKQIVLTKMPFFPFQTQ